MYGWLNHITRTLPAWSSKTPSVMLRRLFQSFLALSFDRTPKSVTFCPGVSARVVAEEPATS
jgi:hypothetical protein